MFLTIPTIMTWTRIVAIPLIVGVFYLPTRAGGQEPDRHGDVRGVRLPPTGSTATWPASSTRPRPSAPFSTRWPTSSWSAPRCWCWCTCNRADVFVALIIIGREIAISALREWMAQIGAAAAWRCT
jgi:cardiolipin synthase